MTHVDSNRPDYIESHAGAWEKRLWLPLAERLALWWPYWLGDITGGSVIDRVKLSVFADGYFWGEIQYERKMRR